METGHTAGEEPDWNRTQSQISRTCQDTTAKLAGDFQSTMVLKDTIYPV